MPQKCNFFFSIPYFLCTANVFFNYFSLFALQMWVTFFNFSTANVFKFLFFFTANVHHFLYTLLKLLPVKCCLKFFSPRPPLRSSLGKLKNNFRGGGAQKKRTFFSLFLILGLCFFLFYCLCTTPIPTISQGFKNAASSKQLIPSKSLSKFGKPKKISAKSLHNWQNGSKNKILAPSEHHPTHPTHPTHPSTLAP